MKYIKKYFGKVGKVYSKFCKTKSSGIIRKIIEIIKFEKYK